MGVRRVGFSVIGIAAALVYFYGLYLNDWTIRQYAKPIPIAILLIESALNAKSKFSKLITIGLVASIIGDVFMEMQRDMFIPGLGSFLIAQLCYTAAFMTIARFRFLYYLPFMAWFACILALIYPQLGEMLAPVAVYGVIIGAMGGSAASTLTIPRTTETRFTRLAPVIGASLFILSDSIIAVSKFYYPHEHAQWFIMITYYLAQFFLTWSGLFLRHPDWKSPVAKKNK